MCFFLGYTFILLIVQKLGWFVSMSFFFGLWYFMMTSRDLLNFTILFVFIKHVSSWHLTFSFFIVFMFNETFFTSFFFFWGCFSNMCFFVLQCCEGFILVSTIDHYFSLSRACCFFNMVSSFVFFCSFFPLILQCFLLLNLLQRSIIVMFLMRAFICSWNFFLIIIILIMWNLFISLEEKLSFTINFCN
jgi:hypothetical protein